MYKRVVYTKFRKKKCVCTYIGECMYVCRHCTKQNVTYCKVFIVYNYTKTKLGVPIKA